MRITQTGRVGIANISPSEALDVTGNVVASGTITSGGNTVLTTADYDVQVCHLKTNVDASVTQGVANEFTVNFNLEEHNDTSTFSHSSGVVTVATAGWYRIVANLVYQNGVASNRNTIRAYVKKNGTEIPSTATYDYDRGSSYGEFSNNKINTMLYLAANDTIEIANYGQNIDGSVTIQSEECEFMVSSETVQATSSNADTVDGLHGSQFLRSDANDTTTGKLTVSNSGTIGGSTVSDGYLQVTDGTNTLAFDANEIVADTNMYIRPTSTGYSLNLANGGTTNVTGNLNVSSGVDVTGNITVTGTVDGVDIAGSIDQAVLTTSSPTFGGMTLNGTLTLGSNVINDVEDIYLRDKLFHDGDTDTYLWFSSDQVQINTGGSARFSANNNGFFVESAAKENATALSGTSVTCNANSAGYFSLTMTGNTTFTFSAQSSGYSAGFVVELTGNGGTVTWPTSVEWAGGTAPDAPASGETDLLVFNTRDGGTTWYGMLAIDAAA
jgi:hypothetical protein